MQTIKIKVGLLIHHKAFEGVETNVISSFTFRGLNLQPHGCDVRLAESQRYFHTLLPDMFVFLNLFQQAGTGWNLQADVETG